MAGPKIEMRPPIHRATTRVLYGDTDAAAVVYYGNYLRYFERGRTEFMRDYLTTYRSLESRDFILPVVECFARYKASAAYDDLLVIETSLVEARKVFCRFNYRILREGDDKLLVLGYTIHAPINREGKLTSLPPGLLARIGELWEQGG